MRVVSVWGNKVRRARLVYGLQVVRSRSINFEYLFTNNACNPPWSLTGALMQSNHAWSKHSYQQTTTSTSRKEIVLTLTLSSLENSDGNKGGKKSWCSFFFWLRWEITCSWNWKLLIWSTWVIMEIWNNTVHYHNSPVLYRSTSLTGQATFSNTNRIKQNKPSTRENAWRAKSWENINMELRTPYSINYP